jgi:hypothetical protein
MIWSGRLNVLFAENITTSARNRVFAQNARVPKSIALRKLQCRFVLSAVNNKRGVKIATDANS